MIALAQVRFPPILSINNPAHIAEFQEAIREDFPEYSLEKTVGIAPASDGEIQIAAPPPLHRLKGDEWFVSLAQDFLAVYTTNYQTKEEFVERVRSVSEALLCLKPSRVNRLGVRFVDRVSDEQELREIETLVQGGFLGPNLPEAGLRRIISRAVWPAKEGDILAHWGFMAPNERIANLDAVSPLEEASWILDLDMFTSDQMDDFNPEHISRKTGEFVDRIYALFLHVFTQKFIERRGGKL